MNIDKNTVVLGGVGRCVVKPKRFWKEPPLTEILTPVCTYEVPRQEEARAAAACRNAAVRRLLASRSSIEAAFFRAVLPSLAKACEAAIEMEKMLAEQGVDPKYLYFSKAAVNCGGLLSICFVTLLASSKNTVSVPALHAAFLAEVIQYVVCSPSFKAIVPVGSPMHAPAPAVLAIFFSTLQGYLVKFLPGRMFYFKAKGSFAKTVLLANEPEFIVVKSEFLRESHDAVVSLPSLEAPQPWKVLDPSGGDQRAFRETYCLISGEKFTVSLRKVSGDIDSSLFASPYCRTVIAINILESVPLYFPVWEAEMFFYDAINPLWEPFYESRSEGPSESQVRDCVNAGFGMPGPVLNVKRWVSLLPEYSDGQSLEKKAAEVSQEFYHTSLLLGAIVFLNGSTVYPEYRVGGCGRYLIVGIISTTGKHKLASLLCRQVLGVWGDTEAAL